MTCLHSELPSNAQSVSTALCSRGFGRACLRRACSFASSARACRAWATSSCIAASSMRAARSSFLCGAMTKPDSLPQGCSCMYIFSLVVGCRGLWWQTGSAKHNTLTYC